VAKINCDIYTPRGLPYPADPRGILKKTIKNAKKLGYEMFAGPEMEFYLVREGENCYVPIDQGTYTTGAPFDEGATFRWRLSEWMVRTNVQPERLHHEVGPGQNEVEFLFANALRSADRVVLFKLLAKTLAKENDIFATFMPKPYTGRAGTGMHVHQSIGDVESGRNLFSDHQHPGELSSFAKSYLAGLIDHAKEIIAILAPTVNSYKRLIPGYEAPNLIAWDYSNRSAMIRIPGYPIGSAGKTRIEIRCPDTSTNPYLTFTVLLAAGLDGVKRGLETPNNVDCNLYTLSPSEIKKLKIQELPSSLEQALDHFEQSKFMRDTLGDHLFTSFLKLKRKEWANYVDNVKDPYTTDVTQWEIDNYLRRS
jgi:glutamine synthetase